MTEPLIEQLIKAYEAKINMLNISIWSWNPGYLDDLKKIDERIAALTKDYRERRRYAVVYKDFETFDTFEEAEQNRADVYYNSEESPDDYETVEIIRNKP